MKKRRGKKDERVSRGERFRRRKLARLAIAAEIRRDIEMSRKKGELIPIVLSSDRAKRKTVYWVRTLVQKEFNRYQAVSDRTMSLFQKASDRDIEDVFEDADLKTKAQVSLMVGKTEKIDHPKGAEEGETPKTTLTEKKEIREYYEEYHMPGENTELWNALVNPEALDDLRKKALSFLSSDDSGDERKRSSEDSIRTIADFADEDESEKND